MTTTTTAMRGYPVVGSAADMDASLADCFGPAPRRISHDAALDLHGCPVMPVAAVSAAVEPDHAQADAWGWRCMLESESTLLVASTHLAGDTWVSDPDRAVLELCETAMGRWEEWACKMLVVMPDMFDAQRIVSLAGQLELHIGLRRLCSMIDALGVCMRLGRKRGRRRFPPPARAIPKLATPPSRSEPWTEMDRIYGDEDETLRSWIEGERYCDDLWRVVWHRDPRGLLREIES